MTQLERELWQHATGMSGLDDPAGGELDGFFSKIFKAAGPILPIAGAALAPFTGGASLVAAGALTAVGNAVTGQPGQPAAPAAPLASPAPSPAPVMTAAPAAGGNSGLILIGIAVLALVLLSRK